jgi:ribosomal protein L1
MTLRSKRYKSNLEKYDETKIYSLEEGIDLIKETSNIKFDKKGSKY